MEMKQLSIFDRLHGIVNIQKRYLRQGFLYIGTAASPLHCYNLRLLQLLQESSDYRRIYICAGRKKFTGDFMVILKCFNCYKHMNRYCKSALNLHSDTSIDSILNHFCCNFNSHNKVRLSLLESIHIILRCQSAV